nr:hypothetical protein [Tanacetum cinerariifolium]
MRRVRKGFSGVETPLFENMLEVREVDAEEEVQVPAQDDVDQENVTEEIADDVAQPISLLPPSPQVLDKCSTLVLRVEGLETANTAQQLEILKLKARVKKLERLNKVLQPLGTSGTTSTCSSAGSIGFKDIALGSTALPLKKIRLSIRRGDSVEKAITINASLVATHGSDNIIKTQTTAMPNVDIPEEMDTNGSPKHQETMGGTPAQTRSERVLEHPNEPPLLEGHTSGSGDERMEHTFKLMDTVPPIPHDSPLTGGYTPGSKKEYMCIYLKNQGGYK